MSEKTLGKAKGLNSIADPSDFKGTRGSGRGRDKQADVPRTPSSPVSTQSPPDRTSGIPALSPLSTLERPGGDATDPPEDPALRRKRRELSIPLPVSQALAETGINPADVVMSAYRTFADKIYAGAGGRLLSRGRERLRLSISDGDFDKITRLGQNRGWNRSETVAVLLTLELLGDESQADA